MMATNVWYLLIVSIATICYGAQALKCYVGQVDKSAPNQVTSLPVSYQTCQIGSDICLTISYEVVVLSIRKPYMQGVCGSSAAGCSVFCTMVKQQIGELMQNCKCSDTAEENAKLQPYISAVTTTQPAQSLKCYVGQVDTSAPKQVTALPVSYQTCQAGTDICLTLSYEVVVLSIRKPYKQGICGSSVAGCSVFCNILKQQIGELMQNCQCSDTAEENAKLQPYVSTVTTTQPSVSVVTRRPDVLLQCYVGQASTTPRYERSSVYRKTCAKHEDACITLQYRVTNGSNELSFTQGVCGVSQVACPIFCQGMETQIGASNFKDCKCYNTKDENDKMAHFLGNKGSRAASQDVLTIIVLSLFSLFFLNF